MIDRIKGAYTVVCDECQKAFYESDYIHDALDYIKDNGWTARQAGRAIWEDICPGCGLKERGNLV
jgi:hypothetical protein